ncbi:hypothetical protein V4890_23980, partial [Ralstonia solanacearum species complex bacterium KE056]|uniref:hypothetical protein n=1 Tax=Ralstonia solanacearum species complex bacterium KE056 TaxID=3119585 RepID=UPI002FC38E25
SSTHAPESLTISAPNPGSKRDSAIVYNPPWNSTTADFCITRCACSGPLQANSCWPCAGEAVTTYNATVKQVGAWALQTQCGWKVEHDGRIFATQECFQHSDDETIWATERLNELMVASGATIVENVEASESGGVCLFISNGLQLAFTPSGVVGEEDWRFFSPGIHAKKLEFINAKLGVDKKWTLA